MSRSRTASLRPHLGEDDAGNQTGNGKPKRRPMINTVNGWEEAP